MGGGVVFDDIFGGGMSRIKRLEFSKPVRLEIFKRAGGMAGLRCEKCNLPIKGSAFEIDHIIEEWEREDVEFGYREALTASDGQLLCLPCHRDKSGKKSGERAHGERIVAKAAKATPKKRPQSKFKKKVDGTVVWRETGEPVK